MYFLKTYRAKRRPGFKCPVNTFASIALLLYVSFYLLTVSSLLDNALRELHACLFCAGIDIVELLSDFRSIRSFGIFDLQRCSKINVRNDIQSQPHFLQATRSERCHSRPSCPNPRE